MLIKAVLKQVLYLFAATLGRHHFTPGNPDLLILMYHRVMPLSDKRAQLEVPGMIVTPDTLDDHIEYLKNKFEIIKLGDWLENAAKPASLPKRACAITFDDGWRDNYEYAFPVLKKHNVSATIFLVSDLINTSKDFWPGRLAALLNLLVSEYENEWHKLPLEWLLSLDESMTINSDILTKSNLRDITFKCKSYSDTEINAYIDGVYRALGVTPDVHDRVILNEEELKSMIDSGLYEIGSHTRSHVRMHPDLSSDDINDQVVNSQARLKDMFNVSIRLFCYPNGDTTEESIAIVKNNYLGACTTKYGWNDLKTDPCRLNRIGIHEDISNNKLKFMARISGWY